MPPDHHRADCDTVVDNRVDEILVGRSRVAVAEHHHVLEGGGGLFQGIVGHAHHMRETRHVTRIHTHDQTSFLPLVPDFREGKQPTVSAVPKNNAHLVHGTQGVQGGERDLAGPIVAVGELGGMAHDHQRPAGKDLLAVQLHVHRQRLLQRRSAIAAGRIGLVPADADQTDAKITHRALDQEHEAFAEIARRHVAQKEYVVVSQLPQRGLKGPHGNRPHIQFRGPQRLN